MFGNVLICLTKGYDLFGNASVSVKYCVLLLWLENKLVLFLWIQLDVDDDDDGGGGYGEVGL